MTIRPFIIGVMTEWVEALVKRKKSSVAKMSFFPNKPGVLSSLL